MQCLSVQHGQTKKQAKNVAVWVCVIQNYSHLLLPQSNGDTHDNLEHKVTANEILWFIVVGYTLVGLPIAMAILSPSIIDYLKDKS
jgi:hypothetical protein